MCPKYATHLSVCDTFVKTVGFSGQRQMIPMTDPVQLSIEGGEAKLPILVSDQTPINLLGKHVLCKLKMKVWCSPQGVYTDSSGPSLEMNDLAERANLYWLESITEPVSEMVRIWKRLLMLRSQKQNDLTLIFIVECIMIHLEVKLMVN